MSQFEHFSGLTVALRHVRSAGLKRTLLRTAVRSENGTFADVEG